MTFAFILRAFCLIAVLVVFPGTALPAYANHQSPFIWPNNSFLWLSARVNHDGEVSVVSDSCDSNLLSAAFIATLETSSETYNRPELPDMPLGYNTVLIGDCSHTGPTDILLQFENRQTWRKHGHSDVGGVTYHFAATADWCTMMKTYHPCGDSHVVIHLNIERIIQPGYPLVGTIKHEMGHATGLDHHCTTDSLMKPPSFD